MPARLTQLYKFMMTQFDAEISTKYQLTTLSLVKMFQESYVSSQSDHVREARRYRATELIPTVAPPRSSVAPPKDIVAPPPFSQGKKTEAEVQEMMNSVTYVEIKKSMAMFLRDTFPSAVVQVISEMGATREELLEPLRSFADAALLELEAGLELVRNSTDPEQSVHAYSADDEIACLRAWGMEQQILSLVLTLPKLFESWGPFDSAEKFIEKVPALGKTQS